jgi:hypothetical protein
LDVRVKERKVESMKGKITKKKENGEIMKYRQRYRLKRTYRNREVVLQLGGWEKG